VLKLFGESPAPGQRARQILENKLKDTAGSWTSHDILFSMVDLDIIRLGKDGMYCPPDDWTAKVDAARQHYLQEREKDEQQRREIAAFLLRQAEAHRYELKYEKAYHTAASAVGYGCLHRELTDLFIEIAFVEAEGPRRELVFNCLQHIGKLTGTTPDTESLPAAGGIAFPVLFSCCWKNWMQTRCVYFAAAISPTWWKFGVAVSSVGEGEEDKTAHPVSVSSFAMARVPVTWEQFALFCIATGRALPAYPSWGLAADNPVVNVSWYDAVEYANWISERLGKQAAYHIDRETKDESNDAEYDGVKCTVTLLPDSDGFRLPTEAEWEYAARGGAEGIRDDFVYSGSNDIDEVAWYIGNCAAPDGIRRTRSVYDTKRPNQLGIAHLSGNVWEWCGDWYGAYTPDDQENPPGALTGDSRVDRGGSWGSDPQSCRAANRGGSEAVGQGQLPRLPPRRLPPVMWFGVRLSREQKKRKRMRNGTEQGGAAIAPACAVEEQLFAVASGKHPGRSPENFLKMVVLY
jgi:formylglycine-generating enzyme required for sulfatase activity